MFDLHKSQNGAIAVVKRKVAEFETVEAAKQYVEDNCGGIYHFELDADYEGCADILTKNCELYSIEPKDFCINSAER